MPRGEKYDYKTWTQIMLIFSGSALLGILLEMVFGWNVISVLLYCLAIPLPIVIPLWLWITFDKIINGNDSW